MFRLIICVTLFLLLFQSCHLLDNIAYNIPDPECTGVFGLCTDIDKERLGRHALKTIHEQMDDDKDGMIEASESTDFIKEELESNEDSFRHQRFQNANIQITFDDLWIQWKHSVVYNWTIDNVVDWLVNYVHLPMYVENFRRNQFDGRMIPRLSINEKHYLSNIMQIRDPRHKRRLIIKSVDVVLFGAPPRTHNLIKDIILLSALVISIGACIYAFIRHRKTQESMKLMLKELETLQKVEGNLHAVTGKMKAVENELQDKAKVDRGLLHSWFLEVQKTKEQADKYRIRRDSTVPHGKQLQLAIQEIEQLRIALRKAEEHAQYQSYEPPSELIDLLKRTYLLEEMAFEVKRKSAETAMLIAKEQMIKISKMQRGFFGAVRIAHTGCMENISELINAAKERLSEVQDECEERERRWNRIATLIDREDLTSNSSLSIPSIIMGNQYSLGSTNTPSNNGNNNNSISSDSNNRNKQISSDSNTLVNTSNDPSLIHKSNGNINNRGMPLYPIQNSQQETMSRSDSGFEYSNSPLLSLKRRPNTNSAVFSNSSTERLALNPKMVYSNSINGLNNSNMTATGMLRQNTDDSFDILSLNQQIKPAFDIINDQSSIRNEAIHGDHHQEYDRRSQTSDSAYDDQQMISLTDKFRKETMSTKLLKPFHNLLFRKKNHVS